MLSPGFPLLWIIRSANGTVLPVFSPYDSFYMFFEGDQSSHVKYPKFIIYKKMLDFQF
jgi:hypothetical protein